jgi:hypothetical protein
MDFPYLKCVEGIRIFKRINICLSLCGEHPFWILYLFLERSEGFH